MVLKPYIETFESIGNVLSTITLSIKNTAKQIKDNRYGGFSEFNRQTILALMN
jgi:hypothetical protein